MPKNPDAIMSVSANPNSACVVLVPHTGTIVVECDLALQELERRGYVVRRVPGYSAIDVARNELAFKALKDGFQETMWIDSDIGFEPDSIDRLRSHNLPMVVGLYPKKGRRDLACTTLPETKLIVFGKNGGLIEVWYAGTGFMHVRRTVYDTIFDKLKLPVCNESFGTPHLPYFQPMVHPLDNGHWYLAEDYAFCERARQAGFKIMADTSVRLWHLGNYRYGWEDAGRDIQRFSDYTFHVSK